MKKGKNVPYTCPHRSREAKVNYICGIGGYSNRDGRWPIEFGVSVYRADTSLEHLWGTYRKEYLSHVADVDIGEYFRVAEKVYSECGHHLFEWAQDDCIHDIDPQWGDTYFTLWDGTGVDVSLSLRGRCGKHLVIDRYRSLTLEGNDEDDLREALMAQYTRNGVKVCANRLVRGGEWAYSHEFVDTLYRYIRQCEVDFTTEKVALNLEYYAASTFFTRVDDAFAEYKKNKADHEAVVSCAQTLRRYLAEREGSAVLQMLRTLSQAAGVSEEELWQN